MYKPKLAKIQYVWWMTQKLKLTNKHDVKYKMLITDNSFKQYAKADYQCRNDGVAAASSDGGPHWW